MTQSVKRCFHRQLVVVIADSGAISKAVGAWTQDTRGSVAAVAPLSCQAHTRVTLTGTNFTDLGDGSGPFAHTLQNLDNTKDYYIRVFAENGEGPSQPCDRTGALCDDGAEAFITAKPV